MNNSVDEKKSILIKIIFAVHVLLLKHTGVEYCSVVKHESTKYFFLFANINTIVHLTLIQTDGTFTLLYAKKKNRTTTTKTTWYTNTIAIQILINSSLWIIGLNFHLNHRHTRPHQDSLFFDWYFFCCNFISEISLIQTKRNEKKLNGKEDIQLIYYAKCKCNWMLNIRTHIWDMNFQHYNWNNIQRPSIEWLYNNTSSYVSVFYGKIQLTRTHSHGKMFNGFFFGE